MPTKTTVSIALVALLGLGLVGCASSSGGEGDGPGTEGSSPAAAGSAPAESPEPSDSPEPTAPLDLTGEWEQSTSTDDGTIHAATIVSDTITIYWVSEDGTRALYWAGTVEVPDNAGANFAWDSVNDRSKTDGSLLSSGDDTKTFTYDNETLSYEVSALGVSWTVELKQTSATPATAPTAQNESSSDFDVKIEGATFASDYEGKLAIVVSFAFTNNSDKAASFLWALSAKAFQGGIELTDIAIGVDGVDSSLARADIQPGVTISVQEAFILRDESPVMVEVRELFDFSDAVIASQEFSVSQ